jgi:hypothetical protein
MTTYGGLGGIAGGRGIDPQDEFEMAVERALGSWIRGSRENAALMWCALSNVDWFHKNGDVAGYSFRAAGDLVAAIRGEGDYMDWYCSGPYGYVDEYISDAMEKEGWTYKESK